jgi:hypothetical protein
MWRRLRIWLSGFCPDDGAALRVCTEGIDIGLKSDVIASFVQINLSRKAVAVDLDLMRIESSIETGTRSLS